MSLFGVLCLADRSGAKSQSKNNPNPKEAAVVSQRVQHVVVRVIYMHQRSTGSSGGDLNLNLHLFELCVSRNVRDMLNIKY